LRKETVLGIASTSVVPNTLQGFPTSTSLLRIEAVSGYIWAPMDLSSFLYNAYLPPKEVRSAYISILFNHKLGFRLASMMGTLIAVSIGNVGSVILLASSVLRSITATIAFAALPEIGEKYISEHEY